MKNDSKKRIQEILSRVKDSQTKQLIFDSSDHVVDAAVQFFYEELKKKRRL
jgi:hypothetical protein